jgi:pimeloyl-ACP methyl ester carboxylesterase
LRRVCGVGEATVALATTLERVVMNEAAYRAAEARLWRSAGVEPVEHWLHLRRNDVDVRVQEVGDGAPALFLHGANTSGISWARLVARVEGLRCLVLDRPGTGLSRPLARRIGPTSLAELGDTLVADVLDALGLRSTHVVATSFGGYIGLRAAAATPDRVDRMVQFSWPLGSPPSRLPLFLRAMSVPGMSRLVVAMPPSRWSMPLLFRGAGHGPKLDDGRIRPEDLDAYFALLRHTDTRRHEFAPARALVSLVGGLKRLYLTDETLAAVRCPTLFIWGGRDPFGGADVAQALVARIPGAELELLPDAGHSPWLDDLEGCASRLSEFLTAGVQETSEALAS